MPARRRLTWAVFGAVLASLALAVLAATSGGATRPALGEPLHLDEVAPMVSVTGGPDATLAPETGQDTSPTSPPVTPTSEPERSTEVVAPRTAPPVRVPLDDDDGADDDGADDDDDDDD